MDLNAFNESQISFGDATKLSMYNNGNWSAPDKKESD